MKADAGTMKPAANLAPVDADLILSSVPDPILVIDTENRIRFANLAAETILGASFSTLQKDSLEALVPFGSPVLALIQQVRRSGHSVSEFGVHLASPRMGDHLVNLHVAPVGDGDDLIVLSLQERSVAQKIGDQLIHRGAARSVAGMAAVLAHEIKNPLSGVRGAAQLIEQNADSGDRQLTRLICEEADRICALVDRMEIFSDRQPIEKKPVNIHEVLDHVRELALAGFARTIRFVGHYDPSLPQVWGDRDQLVQVFLNLVKNAAEAVSAEDGEIVLTTAYRHGVRVKIPGTGERLSLPIEVCVFDNGPGVPEDLKPYLFEAFVSAKAGGTGLGLALVAKLIGDHGGIVECESEPGQTAFRVLLPAINQAGTTP
ncbi:MAG: nitrogen regulation protein NR(II) [Sphingomonadales bacterium]